MRSMSWPRFSLRTILIAVALIAIFLAVIFSSVHARSVRIRLAEIKTLEWFVANPDKWTSKVPNMSQEECIEKMKKRLAEIDN
jgi:hypothetical protein